VLGFGRTSRPLAMLRDSIVISFEILGPKAGTLCLLAIFGVDPEGYRAVVE
jgi:hypothetical protein